MFLARQDPGLTFGYNMKLNSSTPFLRLVSLHTLALLVFCTSPAAITSTAQTKPFKITSTTAQLFYGDKGTFSADAAEDDTGPPYVPPKFWNTPIQYENRSTSVLVIVEVSGDGRRTPERKLEFTARYIPWDRESRPIVVQRIVPVSIPIKVGEYDKYYAGFWLYETGCHPVRLTARIIGRGETSSVKKVIKFGCGE